MILFFEKLIKDLKPVINNLTLNFVYVFMKILIN